MILSFFFLDLIHVAKVHILWIEYILHVNLSGYAFDETVFEGKSLEENISVAGI